MSLKPGEDAGPWRFAQLSDPHLSDLSAARRRGMVGKRALGYLSWRRRRRHEHRRELLDRLQADLLRQGPDHVVVTGDLVHIALPDEFRQARQWLHSLGPAHDVTVVPGNHDRYVRADYDDTLALWRDYMATDGVDCAGLGYDSFPSLRIRGPVAFVGLSSAVPAPPFLATGALGCRQLQRLDEMLCDLRDGRLFRVLLIHHPPVPGEEKWRKRLVDAPALTEVLARNGVDLILHGHRHRNRHATINAAGREVPVFGLASASAAGIHSPSPATYNLYTVERKDRHWSLRVSAHSLGPDGRCSERELARLLL